MLSLILWFYYGFMSIGGWVLFLLLAIGVAGWIWYDSLTRNARAWGWRFAASALWLLLLPAMLFRFTVPQGMLTPFPVPNEGPILPAQMGTGYITCVEAPPPMIQVQQDIKVICYNMIFGNNDVPMAPYYDLIFYLGIFSGLLSMLIAVAYYVNTQTVRARPAPVRGGAAYYPPPAASPYRREAPAPAPVRMKPSKPAAAAWLVGRDGRNYQLFLGETNIGRSPENDIYLDGDTTVSKHHAKITEQNGHFRLVDMGSTNGTRVNGRPVRAPILLQPNDEIQFGDYTVVRFLTSR